LLFKDMSPSEHSTLKKDTLALCSQIEEWSKKYPKAPTPIVTGKQTPQEQQEFIAWRQGFDRAYTTRFGPRALAIVQEYGARGFDVKMIESQAEYGSLPNDLCIKLRAFALRLDSGGNMKP
jgi:hypothetical protein